MLDRAQINKGLIEGCILAVIEREASYGYDIAMQLRQYGFADVKEGTIYPLLVRLEKKGIIASRYGPSPLGPNRRYYEITAPGCSYLQAFIEAWVETATAVDAALGGVQNAGEPAHQTRPGKQ